jgi:hypothetical protein
MKQLLLAYVFLSSRERIAWVEKDNGEYTGKHLLYEWTKLYA